MSSFVDELEAQLGAAARARAGGRHAGARIRPGGLGGAVAILLAAVVIAAVAAVVLSIGSGRPMPRTSVPTSRQPWRPLRAGEYDYQLTLSGAGPLSPHRRLALAELWLGRNGTGQMVQRRRDGQPLIPGTKIIEHFTRRNRFVWVEAGNYQQLIHLPTGPVALKRWIDRQPELRDRSGRAAVSEEFTVVGDITRLPGVPPALRAAFLRVAEQLPGVHVARTRDALGRRGIAVGMTPVGARGIREDLIFDSTGTLLGERTVSLSAKSGAPPGSLIDWSVNALETVVSSDHHLPAKALQIAHRLRINLTPTARPTH